MLFIADQQGKKNYVRENAESKNVINGVRDLKPLIHIFSQIQHVHGVYSKRWCFPSHMNVCIENMV